MASRLHLGPLTHRTLHVCVDMQRLFSTDGPWPTPWMERVLPVVTAIARRHPERTIFTRFIPPWRPERMEGQWRRFYRRWRHVTRSQLDPAMLELMPPLAELSPPADVVDKPTYSGFSTSALPRLLAARDADGIIVTGTETDVCVLATVLGAVDFGYRVVVVEDAVCSSSDAGHEALLTLYRERFTEQIDIVDSRALLEAWPADEPAAVASA